MRRSLRWLIPLSVVPVLALLAFGFRTNPRDIASPLVGRPAPPFTLTAFDGQPLVLENMRGKVVVLNFWASWCYPGCYEEAPILEDSWKSWRDRGVILIGVDIQDSEDKARKFIADFALSFPNAPDPRGIVAIDYGVYGVPETFFIDRAGRIRSKHVGAVTAAAFRAAVEPLISQSEGASTAPSETSPRK